MTGQQLCKAAYDGDAAKVGTLLSTQGAQSFINYQEENGGTPLHIAATNGHESVTKQLIVAQCSVDLQTEDGDTPLLRAASNGHAAVTKQLIAACSKVDLQAKDGCTALHLAASQMHTAVSKQLLAARCNVDIKNIVGATALQFAETMGHAGIATLIRNRKQFTPLLGRRVVINGLVAKPELNGRTGTAVSFDDDKGRYSVELDDTSSSLMIKPPEQTKTQQEDADGAMEKNHEKNRYGAQESKERDGSETGRDRPVPLKTK